MLGWPIRVLTVGLLLFASRARADDVKWTSNVHSRAGTNPALRADASGVHLLVVDGGLVYERLDSTGKLVEGDAVPSSASVTSGFGKSPALALGPDGSLHVAFAVESGTNVYAGMYAKRSASGAWTGPIQVQGPTERGYGPALSVDTSGVAHVAFEAADTTPFGHVNVYRVQDTSVTAVGAVADVRVDDQLDLVAGPAAEVHVLAGNPSPAGYVHYARSTNGGSVYAPAKEVQSSVAGGRIGQPSAALDANGWLHFVYGSAADSSAGGGRSVRYATLQDGNVTSDVRVSADGVLETWHLDLGIGRVAVAGSTRIVAYMSKDEGADVYARASGDGTAWSTPFKVDSGCGDSEGRNTIALAAAGSRAWLACPTGSSVRIARGDIGAGPTPCDPKQPMQAVSLLPADGSGASVELEAVYRHCEGADAFRVVQLRVTDEPQPGIPAVEIAYEAGSLHLEAGSCTPGSQQTLVGAHATLSCQLSSVTKNGNDLTLRAAVSFDVASFSGTHGVFFDAKGGSASPEPRLGWTKMGSFQVKAGPTGWGDAGLDGSPGAGGGAGAQGSTTAAEDSNCGCAVPGRGRAPGWLVALVVLFGSVVRVLRPGGVRATRRNRADSFRASPCSRSSLTHSGAAKMMRARETVGA